MSSFTRKCITSFTVLIATLLMTATTPAFADRDGGRDGGHGITGPCKSLKGGLLAICLIYCDACTKNPPPQIAKYCSDLSSLFLKFAGYPIPCIQKPSISVVKTTDGFVVNPNSSLQLIAGNPVTWNYTVTNTGNVAVKVNSVVDVGTASNPTVTCNPVLPASLAPGKSLPCSATGVVQTGPYANMVTATASSSQGLTATASATGAYVGVTPGITISGVGSSANGTGTALVGQSYTWNYTVTNTGPVPLSSITYSDTLNAGFVGCPTSLSAAGTAGASQTCASQPQTASSPGPVTNSFTATAISTDGSGGTKSVSNTSQATITIIAPFDPVADLLNHIQAGAPSGTVYSILYDTSDGNNNCSVFGDNQGIGTNLLLVDNNSNFLIIQPYTRASMNPVDLCDATVSPTGNIVASCPSPSTAFPTNYTSNVTPTDFCNWVIPRSGTSFIYTPAP